jgi:hypothetical protein
MPSNHTANDAFWEISPIIYTGRQVTNNLNKHNIKNDNSNLGGVDFGDFILKTVIIPPEKEKYMLMWVKRFFSVRNNWPGFQWPEFPRLVQD